MDYPLAALALVFYSWEGFGSGLKYCARDGIGFAIVDLLVLKWGIIKWGRSVGSAFFYYTVT